MKNNKYLASVLMFGLLASGAAKAAESMKNLPLVFDPATKKYFIGGSSKFLLKPGEQTGLIDRIEVAVDGGEYRPYDQAIEFKQEGKHTLKFRAINPVNNWSPVQFVEVFVDLTPASSEAKFSEEHSYKADASLYVGAKSTITLAAQDNLSGVASIEYSWDGTNFTPYSKPIVVEKSGAQALYYRSIDRVGNVEATRKVEYIVDATPPNSEIQLVGNAKPTVLNGKTYVSDSISYAITSADDLSKVKQAWVVIDGKPQMYIKPIYLLEEGRHTLGYYSVDNVGNKETMKTLSFYTVSTPPQTRAVAIGKSINTGGINYANHDFQLKLEAKDNVVGLDHIEMKIDNENDFKTYLEPVRFTATGLHTVTYRSVDRAGNVEPARAYTVSIVNTVPETTLTTAQPLILREGVTYSPAPNIMTFNVGNSSGVGIKDTLVSINDGPFHSYQGPITVAPDNRVYKVAYKSVDKLGNEEQLKSSTFHIMRSIPMVDLFISNGQSAEEQVRTNYLEQAPGQTGDVGRDIASDHKKKKKKPSAE